MPGLVDGKVAVVTGAASGIGRAAAFALDREGAKAIIVADVRKDPREGGTPTHEAVSCEGRFVMCDVSRPADLVAAVAAADEFGGIDIMVNNAGIVVLNDFLEFTEEQYDRQMDVNAKGAFFGTQAAARRMVEKGGGAIVNVSSVLGMVGNGGVTAYSTSKGAIKLLTYSAANYLADKGVRVNAVHPGVVGTELVTTDFGLPMAAATQVFPIPIGRPATADDVSGTIVFLCSSLSDYMTGASLVVDGGMITSM
jgi:NAD(P)-dependent dehydrogenase (short-subunit alcohol dehydrogenase family)